MKIEHLAIWVAEIETVRKFYETYFGAQSNQKYTNPTKQFESYFLTFESGCRLELMCRPDVSATRDSNPTNDKMGYAHLAISVGSDLLVDELTNRMISDGIACIDGPRRTGDGYYESVILDPEGNRIEITP